MVIVILNYRKLYWKLFCKIHKLFRVHGFATQCSRAFWLHFSNIRSRVLTKTDCWLLPNAPDSTWLHLTAAAAAVACASVTCLTVYSCRTLSLPLKLKLIEEMRIKRSKALPINYAPVSDCRCLCVCVCMCAHWSLFVERERGRERYGGNE